MKILTLSLVVAASVFAAEGVVDHYSAKDLAGIKDKLAAGHPTYKSEQLKKYKGHYSMLAYREATGSSEVHEHEADIFVVQEGEGSLLIGGKLVNSHVEKPGELRGTSIAGGETIHYAAGDIFHIPAGVPHQLLVEKGKHISYFVMKVAGQ
jgi:mannose-6-phosphate isomerase-like protein (cupin superfamily)